MWTVRVLMVKPNTIQQLVSEGYRAEERITACCHPLPKQRTAPMRRGHRHGWPLVKSRQYLQAERWLENLLLWRGVGER